MSGESKHTEEPAAAAAAPYTPSDMAKSYWMHTRGHPDDRQSGRRLSEEERRRQYKEDKRREKLRKRLRTIENKKRAEALPGYVRSYYPDHGFFSEKSYIPGNDEDGRVIVKLISIDGDSWQAAWYKGTVVQKPNHIRDRTDYKVMMDRLPKGEWEGDNLVKIKGRWGRDPYWLSRNIIVVDSSRMRKIGKKNFYREFEDERSDKAALNIALASKDKKKPEGASRFKSLKGAKHLDKHIASFLGGRRKTRKKRRKTKRKTKKRRRKRKKRKSKKRRR